MTLHDDIGFPRKLRVLDLFSGIGGFSLGLERAGMKTVAFCEIEKYPRQILAKHWPGVPIYEDVRTLTAARLRADGIFADIICGGFPCQDISRAGKGAGITGERSGLWREYARLIGEVRPRYVLVENVSILSSRGLGDLLGDLAALGFDAEWHCIPASAIGAPHQRDRIWILAFPSGQGLSVSQRGSILSPRRWREGGAATQCGWWSVEPNVDRMAYGVPRRVDRLKGLGNAVVPQIPEIIGRAILAHEQEKPRQPGPAGFLWQTELLDAE